MSGLLTEIADYDEPGSWGRMSEGWPEISVKARDVYAFASCVKSVPYGSYVLVGDVLRVHQDHVDRLRSDFRSAGEPAREESVRRRDTTGRLRSDGLREAAPRWW